MSELAFLWIVIGTIAVVAVILLTATIFLVKHRNAATVQHFGKLVREVGPEPNAEIPFIGTSVARSNQRVQQVDVKIETNTEDNVLVQMAVVVEFYVLPEESSDAHYKLDEAERQIDSHVIDLVQAHVPNVQLEDLLADKDEFSDMLKSELKPIMDSFGYGILRVLVADIDPEDPEVKPSPNVRKVTQRRHAGATEKRIAK